MKELQLKDINSIITSIFTWSVIALGSYVWLFHFIPDVAFEKENFRFVFTRHLFYYLQILLTTSGLLLLHLVFKNNVNKKSILLYVMIASCLMHYDFFKYIHTVMRNNNLYFSVFKTSPDGQSVTSFQYSRIFMLGIISLLLVGSFIFVKRSLTKVFFALLCAGFFAMFYFMHLYIGRQAYLEYQEKLRVQIEMVLNNHSHYEALCKKLTYQCFIIDNDKPFTYAKPGALHRVNNDMDSTDEANDVIGEKFKEFKASKKPQMIFMESNITTDNLRGIAFALKQIGNNQTFILIDYTNLVFALDLYLIYLFTSITVFLIIWITGLSWLYKVHKKIPVVKQLDLVD